MTFQVGHIYTHAKMLDVCMLAVAVATDKFGYDLRVRWFKRNGLDFHAVDDIYIRNEDLKGWKEWSID